MAIETFKTSTNETRFRARLNYKGHRHTKTFTCKTDAASWLKKQRSDIDNGMLPTQEITLKKAILQWLDTPAADGMDKTNLGRIKFFAGIGGRIHPEGFKHANRPVSEINSDHFHYLYDLFEARSYTPATGNRYKSALSTVWKWLATQRGAKNQQGKYLKLKLCSNTSPMAYMNFGKEAEKHFRYLKQEDLPALLNACDSSGYAHMKVLVLTLLFTGQRIGSVNRLEWSEIDLSNGVITFSADKQKNGKGQRKRVNQQLVKILRDHKISMKPSRWVFPTANNSNKNLSVYTTYWQRTIDAASLGYELKVHDIRATHATWMAQDGKSVEQIQAALNHSSPTMAKHYIKVKELLSDASADFSVELGLINNG